MDFLHRFMDAAVVVRHLDVIACVIDHRWLGEPDAILFPSAAHTWSIWWRGKIQKSCGGNNHSAAVLPPASRALKSVLDPVRRFYR
jgi:hypothetical protein